MNCEACRELLADFATETLAPEEMAAVREHLADGCRECHEELDAWRESFAAMALTAPPLDPPASVKRQLLARVRSEETSRRKDRPRDGEGFARWNWRTFAPYIAVSICAIAAGIAAVRWTDHRLERQAALRQEFETRMREVEQHFPHSNVRFASNGGATGGGATPFYLLLNAPNNELHFHAFQLGTPAPGKRFHLWLAAREDRFIYVGELRPDADGSCAAVFPLSAPVEDVVRAVVTEETSPAARPTGQERFSAPFSDAPSI
jgi:hypothetical protein